MPDTKHKKVWREMCHRCHNKDRSDYQYYGERGITVCTEWRESYAEFLKWSIDNGYKEGLTLDRKNNSLGYSPNNCRWVTRKEQVINRRVFGNNTTGYAGIHFHKKNKTYTATISIDKKRIYLGSFKTIKKALEARNQYIIENNLSYNLQEYINEINSIRV